MDFPTDIWPLKRWRNGLQATRNRWRWRLLEGRLCRDTKRLNCQLARASTELSRARFDPRSSQYLRTHCSRAPQLSLHHMIAELPQAEPAWFLSQDSLVTCAPGIVLQWAYHRALLNLSSKLWPDRSSYAGTSRMHANQWYSHLALLHLQWNQGARTTVINPLRGTSRIRDSRTLSSSTIQLWSSSSHSSRQPRSFTIWLMDKCFSPVLWQRTSQWLVLPTPGVPVIIMLGSLFAMNLKVSIGGMWR